jgi:Fungal protein of unknown function (DUF2011)
MNRIRRSEAFSSSSSSSSSPTHSGEDGDGDAKTFLEHPNIYNYDYEYEEKPATPTPAIESVDRTLGRNHLTHPTGQQQEEEEAIFEFRLFATPSQPQPRSRSATHPTTAENPAHGPGVQGIARVNIRSPTPPPLSTGGFVVPFRPDAYYFTSTERAREQEERRSAYAAVAVSGSEVVNHAGVMAWVCFLSPHPPRLVALRRSLTRCETNVARHSASMAGDTGACFHIRYCFTEVGERRVVVAGGGREEERESGQEGEDSDAEEACD